MDAEGSEVVKWNVSIPDGKIKAVVYRVIAKAGNYSDGEEAGLPILTNRMLVTETMPLPVKAKQTKNFTFDKLANSGSSSTLKNHKLTLEFTSNPAWYAVQALPYLMEYPYDCNEQVFSRYYANGLASHIANSNPKIQRVFEQWKNKDALLSNLEKNQELKGLLLEETPWVLQAQSETEQKKRIGLLFDLNKMANEKEVAESKLKDRQLPNGGWSWFPGGRDNRYITQHIITGFGKMDHLGVREIMEDGEMKRVIEKGVKYLDKRMQDDYDWLIKHKADLDEQQIGNLQVQYLYMRSFFKEIPVATKHQKAFNFYQEQAGSYWLDFPYYLQGMIALSLYRNDVTVIPEAILNALDENSITNEELGMYWKTNRGYYWYQAPIEMQAMLIEAFEEIGNRKEQVDEMKTWLLKQKQTQHWKTTKATVEAIYALLLRGTEWLADSEMAEIKVGGEVVDVADKEDVLPEAGTGYFKTSWTGSKMNAQMANVTVTNHNEVVSWGAMYWQYFEDLDKITFAETPLKLKKQLFKEEISDRGPVITPIENGAVKVGDKLKVRIELKVDRDMEYVHLKDMRAAGFEPINVMSHYKWQDGMGYYESTKDAATNFFISYLPKGTYVFEYPLRVAHEGDFSNGITTIQCMYAPEYTAHSEGVRLIVE